MEEPTTSPLQRSASSSDRLRGNRPRRTFRLSIACLRCQRRKIRCDGAVPSCSSCSKVGSECIDGGKQHSIESPRAYIISLQNRVRWLEMTLRTNCPNVSLEEGPQALDIDMGPNDPTVPNTQNPVNLANPSVSDTQQNENDGFRPSRNQEIQPRGASPVPQEQPTGLAHEIGMVSLSAGTDPKYIGPSSGYFFARLLLACARRHGQRIQPSRTQVNASSRFAFLLPQDALSVHPTPLPVDMSYTTSLSAVYFDTIHLQYPFLHQPTHTKLIEKVYGESETSAVDAFQVNMVLAIAATVLSRRLKVSLPSAGYCANAMKYFDKIYLENSLRGLQSLLLLLVYTLNSPSMGLNVWYLNYQCIAALLDLGLQRDLKSGKSISLLEQEMRTRTFWVIYSLDRSVATMMGRPIGLRDEACELRLPADVEDSNLSASEIHPRQEGGEPTSMSSAIHLFKLAQINSEIKYILHSISHKAPPHSYPNIPDFLTWQADVLARLSTWAGGIPQLTGDRIYMTKLCEIKYHSLKTLLLGPSPAIPNPSIASLRSCYDSAIAGIRLYDQLYKQDLLVYSWVTVHSIFLSTITMLHCIWTVPDIAANIQIDNLVADLKAGSNVLSATGEHWSEAKRSRDVLDELSSATVKWVLESKIGNSETIMQTENNNQSQTASDMHMTQFNGSNQAIGGEFAAYNGALDWPQSAALNLNNPFFGSDLYSSILGDAGSSARIDFDDPNTVHSIMQGIFAADLLPGYNFDQDLGC